MTQPVSHPASTLICLPSQPEYPTAQLAKWSPRDSFIQSLSQPPSQLPNHPPTHLASQPPTLSAASQPGHGVASEAAASRRGRPRLLTHRRWPKAADISSEIGRLARRPDRRRRRWVAPSSLHPFRCVRARLLEPTDGEGRDAARCLTGVTAASSAAVRQRQAR